MQGHQVFRLRQKHTGHPESEGTHLMSMGTALKFDLPQGWTARKVATALAREWLTPFRTEPAVKAPRWLLQPVVEDPGQSGKPLWEAGISTEKYEERMNRADLSWTVRASWGRGRATVLARIIAGKDQVETFQVACTDANLPATLFDTDRVDEFLADQGTSGTSGLFTSLLIDKGFRPAAS